MSSKFMRLVNKEELNSIKESRTIHPSLDNLWLPYKSGEVVFLHRDTIHLNYLLSYLEQYCEVDPGEYYLIQIDVPLHKANKIKQDESANYHECVVHTGPICESEGYSILHIATFHCPLNTTDT